MAKPRRPSLADIMQQEEPATASAASAPIAVVPFTAQASPPLPAAESRGRRDKPHTTIYLDPAVRLVIKRIALDYNKKPHDLMIEGIELMLMKYIGKTIREITS